MINNGRKTIGVFVTQMFQEFQDTVSKGICERARELGYNVAFFTNFLGYGEILYEDGERSIADLPRYEDLDGIIILPDTMFVGDFDKYVQEKIDARTKCPVVSVRNKIDKYYNVLIDDTKILDVIIQHFIIDHGFKKINLLTGPKDNPVSFERLESYKRKLQEHGIPFEEERVFFGDFWKFKAYDAINYWFEDPARKPEAIICANDYMAITACNALADRGISVPDDIAVSGCDNIHIAQIFSPAITTAGIPMYQMGIEAVNKIHMHNEGIEQDQNTYLDSVNIIRDSCGCKTVGNQYKVTRRRNRIIHEAEEKDKAIYDNGFMSIELTSIKTVENLYRRLAYYIRLIRDVDSFYMCLRKNWEAYNKDEDETKDIKDQTMVMEVGIRHGKLQEVIEFTSDRLLPDCLAEDEPQIFFFNMLHYQDVVFGYTAISFHNNETYKRSYQAWLINACNALENIRIHNELNLLVYKLEDMYIKDEMTGLYNRRALEVLGQKYLKQCLEENTKLMVFTADMDKLKYINDNYGHACGDIAIKAVANALLQAATDDEICIRLGGDEFMAVGMDYDQTKVKKFIERFEEGIERFNQMEIREYKVNVSFGWSIIQPTEDITIEDCLLTADAKMYQQKYEKEALRLKHLM